jgi:tellurite resistance protein TerC
VREAIVMTYEMGRKLIVGLAGTTVALIGVAMLVLPGPGLLVLPLGLAILSAEFAFARRWLRGLKLHSQRIVARWPWPRPAREDDAVRSAITRTL